MNVSVCISICVIDIRFFCGNHCAVPQSFIKWTLKFRFAHFLVLFFIIVYLPQNL